MALKLILARASNGVVGQSGTMPWHLPEDMAHFKRATAGGSVIMGRRTWESLPAKFRPLPGRLNVVMTRQADWASPGALRADSLAQAMALCPADKDIWAIGGAQIWAEALPLAQLALVTEIDAVFEGDTFAPKVGPEWQEIARSAHQSINGLKFSFVTYQRKGY